MIGSIIGDIVGSVYEFTPNNIKTKQFEFFNPNGSYTDDSILTFATADWLLHGGEVAHYYSKYVCSAAEAKWFSVNELSELKLAFDHAQIIQDAVERLRERIHFEPIGFNLLDKEFTMPQLQNIYIAILNPPEEDNTIRDRRNFPKKMLKLGYIKETGKKVTGNPYRSPKLYTFDEEAYKDAKKIGMRLEF